MEQKAPIKCPDCGQTFTQQKSAYRHARNVHKQSLVVSKGPGAMILDYKESPDKERIEQLEKQVEFLSEQIRMLKLLVLNKPINEVSTESTKKVEIREDLNEVKLIVSAPTDPITEEKASNVAREGTDSTEIIIVNEDEKKYIKPMYQPSTKEIGRMLVFISCSKLKKWKHIATFDPDDDYKFNSMTFKSWRDEEIPLTINLDCLKGEELVYGSETEGWRIVPMFEIDETYTEIKT
jgi:hypothetical protein